MAAAHGHSPLGILNDIKNALINHIMCSMCGQTKVVIPSACANFWWECPLDMMQPSTYQSELQILFLSQLLNKICWRSLCQLLDTYNIMHDHNGTLNTLCQVLKAYIEQLHKDKSHIQNISWTYSANFVRRSRICDVCLQIVPQSLRNRISQLFCLETSSETLSH